MIPLFATALTTPLVPEVQSLRKPGPYPIILSLIICTLTFGSWPLHATGQDDQIEAAAQSSYVFKTFSWTSLIRAESKDGVVTLTGAGGGGLAQAPCREHRVQPARCEDVINQITVKEGAPEHSDTWLYLKVKSALAMHRSLSVFSTQVEMKEGVVTLRGKASSQAQKELATEYAKDVEGIKDVNNEMTVATTPEAPPQTILEMIDDASITAQVRVALLSHRSTSALTDQGHDPRGCRHRQRQGCQLGRERPGYQAGH